MFFPLFNVFLEHLVAVALLPYQCISRTSGSSWRDIKVVNDHAYIVSEAGAHGMQVFDLTRLRTADYNGEPMMPDSHYGLVGNSHNIVMNQATQRVFIVGATALDLQYDSCFGKIILNIKAPIPSFYIF